MIKTKTLELIACRADRALGKRDGTRWAAKVRGVVSPTKVATASGAYHMRLFERGILTDVIDYCTAFQQAAIQKLGPRCKWGA
jgi:hypothetical protein